MNDPIRAAAMEEWQRILYDQFWWKACPLEQRAKCRDFADGMLAAGIVDELERLDMADLITGALTHYSEEVAPTWIHGATDYRVMNRAGDEVGRLYGGHLCWGHRSITYSDAMIHPHDTECVARSRMDTKTIFAEFHGRWMARDGEWFGLVELERRFNGVMRSRLSDRERYRMAMDMAAAWLEVGNWDRYWDCWDHIHFSEYSRCTACCDRALYREECIVCYGDGFVDLRDSPTRLPSEWPRTAAPGPRSLPRPIIPELEPAPTKNRRWKDLR